MEPAESKKQRCSLQRASDAAGLGSAAPPQSTSDAEKAE